MTTTSQTSNQTAATAPWPEGVVVRYLTIGGATVDIRGSGGNTSMKCLGCDLYYGAFGERRTRELAQEHSETCRALPRPIV